MCNKHKHDATTESLRPFTCSPQWVLHTNTSSLATKCSHTYSTVRIKTVGDHILSVLNVFSRPYTDIKCVYLADVFERENVVVCWCDTCAPAFIRACCCVRACVCGVCVYAPVSIDFYRFAYQFDISCLQLAFVSLLDRWYRVSSVKRISEIYMHVIIALHRPAKTCCIIVFRTPI